MLRVSSPRPARVVEDRGSRSRCYHPSPAESCDSPTSFTSRLLGEDEATHSVESELPPRQGHRIARGVEVANVAPQLVNPHGWQLLSTVEHRTRRTLRLKCTRITNPSLSFRY